MFPESKLKLAGFTKTPRHSAARVIFERETGRARGRMQTSVDPMLRVGACGALMKKLLPFASLKRVAIVTLVVTVLAGVAITDGVYTSYFFYVNWSRLQGAADAAAEAGV